MNGYELLTEKNAMWAQMLMDMLQQNGIPCRHLPVYGAGLAVSAGLMDRWKVYVPADRLQEASDFLQAFFPEEEQPE